MGPFLVWDNAATAALLDAIAARVPALRDAATPDAPDEPAEPIAAGELAALDAVNEQLRARLAEAVPVLAAEAQFADLHAAVVAHLRERITRYPYTSTGSLPSR